jgi:hypothetical protein
MWRAGGARAAVFHSWVPSSARSALIHFRGMIIGLQHKKAFEGRLAPVAVIPSQSSHAAAPKHTRACLPKGDPPAVGASSFRNLATPPLPPLDPKPLALKPLSPYTLHPTPYSLNLKTLYPKR